jgi:hypothetical protein
MGIESIFHNAFGYADHPVMKATKIKPTSPVIVPIKGKDLQKDYALTPVEGKKVVTKLSGLHAKR